MHAIGAAQFWMLSDEMIATSSRLQKEADNERLALFIGAGASFPSGLPSWGGLPNLSPRMLWAVLPTAGSIALICLLETLRASDKQIFM